MINKKYKDYINKKYGSYFRTLPYPYENTLQDMIRNNLIDGYIETDSIPEFMISISYYTKEMDLAKIRKNNHWMNKVLSDFFNPRKNGHYYVSKDHFIEQRKSELKKTSAVRVKNTIIGSYEYDFLADIFGGSYDSHHLIGPIKDSVIDEPSPKIEKALSAIYDSERPRGKSGEPNYLEMKKALLEYALRQRCNKFIGHSSQSIVVSEIDDRYSYQGFSGFRGAVAYVTKYIKTADDLLTLYDSDNSDSFPTEK
jgi:hypothetical protein